MREEYFHRRWKGCVSAFLEPQRLPQGARRNAALVLAAAVLAVPLSCAPASAKIPPNFLRFGEFEEDPWGYYHPLEPKNNSWSRYCDGDGFYSRCFVEFKGGRSDRVSLYQDARMPVTGNTNVVADAVVRCPRSQEACVAVLAVWGDPGSSDQESQTVRCDLPADGRWYYLRLDGADDVLGNNDATFARSHHTVRWELYNRTPRSNLDVDDAYLTDSSRGGYFPIYGAEGICDAYDDDTDYGGWSQPVSAPSARSDHGEVLGSQRDAGGAPIG